MIETGFFLICFLQLLAFCRIPVPVLSVVSTQYKTVLDALRSRKEQFLFENVMIALKPSVLMFITMNPGYPGRAELPESVKVLLGSALVAFFIFYIRIPELNMPSLSGIGPVSSSFYGRARFGADL